MDQDYQMRQLEILKEMVERGHKQLFWSPSLNTALAETELELAAVSRHWNGLQQGMGSFFLKLFSFLNFEICEHQSRMISTLKY